MSARASRPPHPLTAVDKQVVKFHDLVIGRNGVVLRVVVEVEVLEFDPAARLEVSVIRERRIVSLGTGRKRL
jgi:hypothetical protein